MPVTSQQFDGQNVVVTVALPSADADLIAVDIVTGVVTSAWLNAVQLANLGQAALAFFAVVPLAERTSVAFLNRLVSVTSFEDWTVSLSAVTTAPNEQTLRATIDPLASGGTQLVITLPHSITGAVATSGIGSGGGGGGGGGNLLGDVTGPLAANTVERIRNLLIDPFLAPVTNDKLGWNGSQWTQQSATLGNAYDVSSFITGFPGAGATLMQVRGVRNSRITRIKLWVAIAPLADAAFLLTGQGSGSIAFTLLAGQTQVTATGSFLWFDNFLLTLFAPAVQDVQMQDINWTIQGAVL